MLYYPINPSCILNIDTMSIQIILRVVQSYIIAYFSNNMFYFNLNHYIEVVHVHISCIFFEQYVPIDSKTLYVKRTVQFLEEKCYSWFM